MVFKLSNGEFLFDSVLFFVRFYSFITIKNKLV